MADSTKIVELPVGKLNAHRLNEYLYQDGADEELVESVRKHGILTPIQATGTGKVIISGHRRLDAAKRLGLATVPVILLPKMFPEDETEMLIEMNRQRPKTNEQKAREAHILTDCETKRRRRLKREASDEAAPVFNESVRESVAKKLGVSPEHVKRSVAVTNAIDEAERAGDTERAGEIREQVNQSVKKAADLVTKPKPKKERPDAWQFDREGTLVEIDAADASIGEAIRCVKSAVVAQGDESDFSRKFNKKATEIRVILKQWKERVQ